MQRTAALNFFFADYNGFRGGHNILKLLNSKTENLPVPGF
ncbi:Uncharacterized protein dnm_012870 [Desulfonema magnum]|uniref:Uncharacterized protein n=1 Tax=Desulfonema magnum TaxID=45655 RepID=A0A975BGW2_9BACT|nr:Uncharacterized protein dnm_012870 [Desulfonema magnum]